MLFENVCRGKTPSMSSWNEWRVQQEEYLWAVYNTLTRTLEAQSMLDNCSFHQFMAFVQKHTAAPVLPVSTEQYENDEEDCSYAGESAATMPDRNSDN